MEERRHPRTGTTFGELLEQWMEVSSHESSTRERYADLIRPTTARGVGVAEPEIGELGREVPQRVVAQSGRAVGAGEREEALLGVELGERGPAVEPEPERDLRAEAAKHGVLSVNNVMIWPDRVAGLRELHSVLLPGGRLLVSAHDEWLEFAALVERAASVGSADRPLVVTFMSVPH